MMHNIKMKYPLIVISAILIIMIYVWVVSAGHWTAWPSTDDSYSQLAEGFDHKQLSLLTKPDPALLALRHPYDYNSRQNVPYLWDASLYNGKYYIYWGPVPALILVLIKLLYNGNIGDQYITFAFITGTLLFSILMLLSIQSDFFSALPTWEVLIGVFVVGLVTPIPWLLHRPYVYEAAISGEQFFLIGGIYWAYSALTKPSISKWSLLLAGTFWVFAFGSRVVAALPIAFLIGILLFVTAKNFRGSNFAETVLACLAIGTPIVLGIAAYGWYNWARFGSIYEFGLRYQLNKDNLLNNYDLVFSTSYIRINLKNYLLNPLQTVSTFPFVQANVGADSLIANTPGAMIYRARNITGLVYCLPFALFAIVPLVNILPRFVRIKSLRTPLDKHLVSITSLSVGLAGGALLAAIPLLLYFRVAMRFLFDFTPMLALLTVIGFWQGYQLFLVRPIARILYSIIALGLSIFSIVVSILLSISFYNGL
jgi:hypothetical protein